MRFQALLPDGKDGPLQPQRLMKGVADMMHARTHARSHVLPHDGIPNRTGTEVTLKEAQVMQRYSACLACFRNLHPMWIF
jgi:hypothetical protein